MAILIRGESRGVYDWVKICCVIAIIFLYWRSVYIQTTFDALNVSYHAKIDELDAKYHAKIGEINGNYQKKLYEINATYYAKIDELGEKYQEKMEYIDENNESMMTRVERLYNITDMHSAFSVVSKTWSVPYNTYDYHKWGYLRFDVGNYQIVRTVRKETVYRGESVEVPIVYTIINITRSEYGEISIMLQNDDKLYPMKILCNAQSEYSRMYNHKINFLDVIWLYTHY